jgi:hypothetical protein
MRQRRGLRRDGRNLREAGVASLARLRAEAFVPVAESAYGSR